MVPVSHVLAFAAVVTVLIAIPGPSVLSESPHIQQSWKVTKIF